VSDDCLGVPLADEFCAVPAELLAPLAEGVDPRLGGVELVGGSFGLLCGAAEANEGGVACR
jgi:hypothetical protein